MGVLVGGTQVYLFVLRNWLVWLQRPARPESAGLTVKPCLPPAQSWPGAPAGWRHREGPTLAHARSPVSAASPLAGEVSLSLSVGPRWAGRGPVVEGSLLYSHFQCEALAKNTLADTSRVMLDRLSGHRGPAKSTRKVNQHVAATQG